MYVEIHKHCFRMFISLIINIDFWYQIKIFESHFYLATLKLIRKLLKSSKNITFGSDFLLNFKIFEVCDEFIGNFKKSV